ncbi:MAG: M4 family metallopeptidase [Nocardioidaceae bacterium]
MEAPTGAASLSDRSLVEKLRDNAAGSVTIAREPATRSVGFVKAGRNGDLMPGSSAASGAKADAFLDEYGAIFGATRGTLVRDSIRRDGLGGSTVTYLQEYKGVPVFGAMLLAHLDKQGDLTAVNGMAVPGLDLSVSPRLSAAEAGSSAVAAVKADPPSHDGKAADTTGIRAVKTDLVVYREGIVRGVTGDANLAYVVEVSNGHNIRDIVIVTAQSGKVLNRYSLVHDALDRVLHEKRYGKVVWREGKMFPRNLNEDQQNIVRATGESYWFFKNAFGRDSYDGAGHRMESVNNDPRISCPNANWNGLTTNYCNGVTSDDVVAHEWGHAYTEYTHGLIYQWQSGALNESYSDIWGETVDLINGRQDEGEDLSVREDGLCSESSPALARLIINSPADIAKICQTGTAAFGPAPTTAGVSGDVVQGVDAADAAGPSTTDGCTALTNGADVAGKIALIDRGSCAFTIKVKNAQNAGAIAAVIGNNVEAVNGMSGVDPTITISSVMIKLSDRNLIVDKLTAGTPVNVTIKDVTGTSKSGSERWLIGEKSTAFGGAIRDMWMPTCHGDPGKVSDAEYYCAPDDGGGVHSNSGVPNHGYALLVDGGSYNGYDIDGIGLTKAAHIYWRAMTQYQTPTTDFMDHADALEASCADLIGRGVNGLSTAGAPENTDPPTELPDEVISAGDCAQVGAVVNAVELRTEPTQCNFQPLLQPGEPTTCEPGTSAPVWSEDFESGSDGWAMSSEWVFDDQSYNWSVDGTLPGDRTGSAAFGPDPDAGNCSSDVGDVSGVMHLTSGDIAVTGDTTDTAFLTFDHYIATEAGYDGGNVKISVNGGAFEAIAADAYTFNKPLKLTDPPGNTNPLAGQPGFTGTDGGELGGTWGTSAVDLSMVGVTPGDTVKLQLDMGLDGCSGVDGWYVDDITVDVCPAAAQPAKATRES